MQVPLLDLRAHYDRIGSEVQRQVQEVFQSCHFVNGPKVTKFEAAVAEYIGVEHAVGVSSGTDALLISLMALNVGQGDFVITTPYSFFATAGAISRLGATPVFVDIDPLTYNIDPEQLRRWFKNTAERASQVKAIIPVHLYGQCADMSPILKIAAQHDIAVVEDAAQSIGSRYEHDGRISSAGSMGELGCFSFFPSKNLGGACDGGMVVTRNEEMAERLRRLRNHGSFPKYYHELIGGNFRLDALQAAVLLAKLPHLDTWHSERQANAHYYDERFAKLEAVTRPHVAQKRSYHIYNQYVLRVSRRDGLRKHLAAREIGSEVYYPVPFHQQVCFQSLGYSAGAFPQAEAAAPDTVAIPIYPELTHQMQSFVVKSIEDFYA